jgi:hypothetical protein
MQKTCTKCGETHPSTSEFFYKASANRDGMTSECKPCFNARNKAYASLGTPKRLRRMYAYKQHDIKAGRDNDLTGEFFLKTTEEPCTYCGTTADIRGLDRLDNSLGHLQSNVVSCCTECNRVRSDTFSPSEMKLLGATIAHIRSLRNAETR